MSVVKNENNKKWLHGELGAYFKTARLNAGLTQLEIAEHLSVTPQYICNYENGAAGFGGDLVRGFIKHYKLSANTVIEDLAKIQKKYLEAEIKGSSVLKKAKRSS